MTWDEACAAVTAPGSLLELKDGPHGSRVFANPPSNMRDVFALARDGGDATFLVYEDERWSFTDAMASVDALASLTDVKVLGAITPLGGLCFLAGWICLVIWPPNA